MEMIRIRPNSPALFAVYTDRDTFLVSFGGYDSGYLYECAFDQEEPLYVRDDVHDGAVGAAADMRHFTYVFMVLFWYT